jgi:hypothetical protein
MSRTHRHRTRHVIAAITLAAPWVVFASPSPTAAARQEATETRPAPESASALGRSTLLKGALLREVVESLGQGRGHNNVEASPFEPPGKPPGRPPDNPPGHHDPPNPPGQPPDRPPGHAS